MKNTIDKTKIKQALDILLEGDVDLSNALGQGGLLKQLSKSYCRRCVICRNGRAFRL